MAKAKDDLVTTAHFARVIGKTSRWVNELTRNGVLVQAARGKYLLGENVQRYIGYIEKKAEDDEGLSLNVERARHEKVKREIAEIELAAMKGEMHRGEDVEYVLNDMIAAFRSKMLGLPSKLAPQIVGVKSIPVALEMLQQEVHEALSELAEYDPQTFLAVSEDYVEVESHDGSS